MKQIIHPQFAVYTEFIQSIPERLNRGEGTMLHDGRNKVALFTCQGQQMVVKRFKRANFVQRLAYSSFYRTKAERAYYYAGILRSRGIRTPHEIAYFEEKEKGLFTTGWFISENCPDPQTFAPLFEPEHFDKALAKAVAQQVAMMHQKGVFFGDLNLRNFLYRKEDGSYSFTMVDTNRSHFVEGELSQEESLKNMQTLSHRRDLYRFILKEYALARGWDPQWVETEGIRHLDEFESRNARKKRIKNLFKK